MELSMVLKTIYPVAKFYLNLLVVVIIFVIIIDTGKTILTHDAPLIKVVLQLKIDLDWFGE